MALAVIIASWLSPDRSRADAASDHLGTTLQQASRNGEAKTDEVDVQRRFPLRPAPWCSSCR